MGNMSGKKKYGLLPVVAAIGAVFFSVTAARYVTQQKNHMLTEAKNFYFTSNLLKDETDKASYFVDPEKDILIELYNYADSLRQTPGEIGYEIRVEGGAVSSDTNHGTLGGAGVTSESSSVITVVSDQNAEKVVVTVTSKNPYTKSLTASFERKLGNEFTLEDAAGNTAAVLTMICKDDPKDIRITLPEGVIPDSTNDNIKSYSGNICTYHSQGNGIYSLVLLKKDAAGKLTVDAGTGTFADEIVIK